MSEATGAPDVAVVGLGLMGGSLARALKATGYPGGVLGADPVAAHRDAAVAAGAVDHVASDPAHVVSHAGVVVYATPLDVTLDILERHRDTWLPHAWVTDLASLKLPVRDRIRALELEDRWIGAHPWTGGDGSGFGASREDLYAGAPVFLVSASAGDRGPSVGPHGDLAARAEGFWRGLGAVPHWTDAAEHDRRMTLASHVPQLVSNALAAVLAREGLPRTDLGPGGRDVTRLAGSAPEMWLPLLRASGPEAGRALGAVARELEQAGRALEAGDLESVERLMRHTRAWSRGQEPEDTWT